VRIPVHSNFAAVGEREFHFHIATCIRANLGGRLDVPRLFLGTPGRAHFVVV
jgi:hypothetical protein